MRRCRTNQPSHHAPLLPPHPPCQVCENDCGYCGIRKHQRRARRYTMPREEVVEVAEWAFKHRMGTLMLQSGELNTPQRMDYLEDVVGWGGCRGGVECRGVRQLGGRTAGG